MGYPEAAPNSRSEDNSATAVDGQTTSTTEKSSAVGNKRTKKRNRLATEGQETPRSSRKHAPIPADETSSMHPPMFRLDPKADELQLSNGGLDAFNEKGYCSARGNYLFTKGSWYYEINIVDFTSRGCARVGWATNYSDLQANVGFDIFGYAYRSSPPSKVHDAFVYPYGKPYGPGDTVGFYIYLPEIDFEAPKLSADSHVPFNFNVRQKDPNPPVKGSFIEFYVNGECQGRAFEDISYGHYTAAVSLFGGAKVSCNFGPNFKHPPPDRDYQPLSLLAELVQKKYEADMLAKKEQNHDMATGTYVDANVEAEQEPEAEPEAEVDVAVADFILNHSSHNPKELLDSNGDAILAYSPTQFDTNKKTETKPSADLDSLDQ